MAVFSMFIRLSTLLICLCVTTANAELTFQPLGQDASEITKQPQWNLSIKPDGTGLPVGSGTARHGKKLFDNHCASCHGFDAIGASAMPLVGEVGSLTSEYPEKTVNSYWPHATTLFDYIRRAMPPQAPYSLSSNEIYTICAYILYQDNIIGIDEELNEDTLPTIKMPNRNGFSVVYPE